MDMAGSTPYPSKSTRRLNTTAESSQLSYIPCDSEVIVIPPSEYEEGINLWKNALVGVAIGKKIYYKTLVKEIKKSWHCQAQVKVIGMENGFFLLDFDSDLDCKKAEETGLFMIKGFPFVVKRWCTSIQFAMEDFKTISIWIRFPKLPINLWTSSILSRIISKIGKPIALDEQTEKHSRLGFARAYCEISTCSDLPSKITLNINGKLFNQVVEYEWIPKACKKCNTFLHSHINCPFAEAPQQPALNEHGLLLIGMRVVRELWGLICMITHSPQEIFISFTPQNLGSLIHSGQGSGRRDMSNRGGRKAHLLQTHDSHVRNIEETFQILGKPAASSLEIVEWSQVIKLGDEISKQATVAGMLWSEEASKIKQLEENLKAYFNLLHGFVFLCHGSTVGADPTLLASICASARHVGDSSLALLSGAVSCEPSNSSKRSSAPQLSGSVWEACANLKKTPTSNCTAVGQAITHVAVLVNDVLREMNELKPAAFTSSANASTEDNDSGVEDLGDDLSPEEMVIAQLATKAVSDVLVALKEIIRFVSVLLKSNNESMEHVEALDILLCCCQEIGTQVNEVGASVYPPQEFSVMESSAKKIHLAIDEIHKIVEIVGGSHQRLLDSFEGLESSLREMKSGLGM